MSAKRITGLTYINMLVKRMSLVSDTLEDVVDFSLITSVPWPRNLLRSEAEYLRAVRNTFPGLEDSR